jgi:CMP-N-acetylneuraminic acid synthetase
MYTIEQGQPKPLLDVPAVNRRQEFPAIYVRNGSIYAVKREVLLRHHNFYGLNTRAFIMPASRSINIDTEADLMYAEFLITHLAASGSDV